MTALYSAPPLRMARLAFELRPKEELRLPVEMRSNVLRGTFGSIFQRAVCRPDCPGAQNCNHRAECAYAMLFEPDWRTAGHEFRRGEAPRPFLFRPSREDDPVFSPTRPLCFELRLFGQAIAVAQFFVYAFQQLARNRLYGCPVDLTTVRSLDWSGSTACLLISDGVLTGSNPFSLAFSDFPQDPDAGAVSLGIEFVTPILLKDRSVDLRIPTFPALIKRLRDRIAALCRLYEDHEWQADFAGIGRSAEVAFTENVTGTCQSYNRVSSRTGQKMPLEGFQGIVYYRNISSVLLSLLRIGEQLHVGRHAVWGHGQFHVCQPDR